MVSEQQVTPSQTNSSVRNQALQELLQTLNSPSTPEQQQRVLHLLRSNPQLMPAYIKHKLQQHQQQQQNQWGG